MALSLIKSDKHKQPPDEQRSEELSKPFDTLENNQIKLIKDGSNILSNDMYPSVFQNIHDVYLVFFSNKLWHKFLELPTMVNIKNINPTFFQNLKDYKTIFDIIAFKPIQEYFDLNNPPFPGDCNLILEQFLRLYHRLKVLESVKDTVIMYMSQHKLARKGKNETVEDEADELSDDDDDSEYDKNIIDYDDKLEPWTTLQQKPKRICGDDNKEKVFYSYAEQLELLVTGYARQLCQHFVIDAYIIGEFIKFAGYAMWQAIRELVPNDYLDMKANTFKHYQTIFTENYLEIFELSGSEISNDAIKSKFNIYSILNAVHSPRRLDDIITFLLIKYFEIIHVYMILRVWDGDKYQWYGTRITPYNLSVILPKLFEYQRIDICGDLIRRLFMSATDIILQQFASEIMNEPILKSHNLYNSFESDIMKILQASESRVTLEEILGIFDYGKITRDFFIDGNRNVFMHLLKENNVSTYVANELWVGLGGLFGDYDEVFVDDIEKENENETDLNLDELDEDIEAINN